MLTSYHGRSVVVGTIPTCAGATHSLVLTEGGAVYSFGEGEWGRLGATRDPNHAAAVSMRTTLLLCPGLRRIVHRAWE